MLTWTNSAGGPLVLAGPELAGQWRPFVGAEQAGDYEAACKVDEYVAVLKRPAGAFLVLGDEPLATTILCAGGQLVIARWVFSDSSGLANSVLSAIPAVLPHLAPAVPFEHLEGSLCLFDAVDGAPAIGEDRQCALLAPMRYLVSTELYAEEPSFSFILHRFSQES